MISPDDMAGPSQPIGRPHRPGRTEFAILAAAALGAAAFDLTSRQILTPALYLGFLVCRTAIQALRPPTVVAHDGIHRPWRRARFIPWDQIASISPAQPGFVAPRVVLTGGGTVDLTDIPTTDIPHIAAIGGKPVAGPPLPAARHVSPHPAKAGDTSRETDIDRRIQALKTRWVDLAAQNRHQPYPGPTTGDHAD